ncbi:MAG TPA: hypothetical protein VIJ02_06540 [Thermoanaerobaculia bacterium]
MSQHARRVLAACGLLAALLLAAPAPSRAAGPWEILAPTPGIAVRVRTWLEGWLPGPRRAAVRGGKSGSGVDPNGAVPTTLPTSGSTSNQQSGVDPNGAN